MCKINIIYADNQSTTKCDALVVDSMLPYFSDLYGNPHSKTHICGQDALNAVEEARSHVARIINATSKDIIFTSGATESNNLAIKGAAKFYQSKGNRIIISAIEHKCVIEAAFDLQRFDGFEIIVAPVNMFGIVDINFLKKHINENIVLVSIMAVNNEIGTIQPINEISDLCRQHNVLFHTDAAQAIGKIDIDAQKVDLMSISSHKIYGPKGIGALYVRNNPKIRLMPLFSGGGQERGMRSGTLPTPLCVGFGKACELAHKHMHSESQTLTQYKDYFLKEIFSNLSRVYLNGDADRRIPGCINLSFAAVEGESIMLMMKDVCMSSGSACTSESLEPSYVLKAINVAEDVAHSSIRVGFGRFTTFDEVQYIAKHLIKTVNRLRDMSPLW